VTTEMEDKRLEEATISMKLLPVDIFVSINELVSEYGGSLVKIGRHWSLTIHFWKYTAHIPIRFKRKQ